MYSPTVERRRGALKGHKDDPERRRKNKERTNSPDKPASQPIGANVHLPRLWLEPHDSMKQKGAFTTALALASSSFPAWWFC